MTSQLANPLALFSIRFSGLIGDTISVSSLTILAKLIGAGKAVVIARAFGSGVELDAYLLAFLVPSFIADVFFGALLTSLVPVLIETEQRQGKRAAESLIAAVQRRSFCFSAIGAAVLLVPAALIAWSSATPQRFGLAAGMVAAMTVLLPITALANLWRSVLYSQRLFAAPAAASAAVPAVLIVCVAASARSLGVWSLVLGTILGAIAELTTIGISVRRSGCALFPPREIALPLGRLRREFRYLAAAAAVSAGGVVIAQAMAAALGDGAVSVLNYGTRIVAVILAVGPSALGVTVLPYFSAMVATGSGGELSKSLSRLLIFVGVVSAAATGLLIALSPWIVRVIFERGAFTAEDTAAVAVVQQLALLQIPFAVCTIMLMRTLTAFQANSALLPVSAATLAVNVVLNYILSIPYGVAGIALAMSASQAGLCLALSWLVLSEPGRRRLCLENAT